MYKQAAYKLMITYIIHLMVYAAVRFCQLIYWRLIGVSEHLSGKEYESSAQVLKVWHRAVPKAAVIHHRRHFITTHERFVHPEYALQKHIVLMTVTKDEAIFCVPNPAEDVTNTSKYPFLFISLYENAEYLLIMPTSSMIRLAEGVDNNWQKIIWLHHPGRAGSTALAQAFNSLSNTVVLSEPHADFSISHMYRSRNLITKRSWHEDKEYKSYVRAAVKLLAKAYLKDATVLFIKTAPMNSPSVAPLIRKVFPEIQQFFMYRDAAPQVTSLCKAIIGQDFVSDFTRLLAQKLSLHLYFSSCQPVNLVYNISEDQAVIAWLTEQDQLKQITDFGEFAIGWASACHDYRRVIETINWKEEFKAFRYEDMQKNCKKFLEVLFRYLDMSLSAEDLREMLRSLQHDSQKNSYINRNVTRGTEFVITEQMVAEANKYFQFMHLPKWGEETVLPNTIRI